MWFDEGWIDANWVHKDPCSHHDARPLGAVIDTVVIHCISLPERGRNPEPVRDLFLHQLDCNSHPEFAALEGLKVSSHFLIDRNGAVSQFVSCDRRAWHAGTSAAMNRQNFNHFSIGIELLGDVYSPFEDAQYASLSTLMGELARRYPLRYVLGHSEIAPTRKTDPGPFFEWKNLRKSHSYEILLQPPAA